MRRISIYFIAVLLILGAAAASTETGVNVKNGLFFYGHSCVSDSNCTSNLCVSNVCGCILDSDCTYGGICTSPICISNASMDTEYQEYSPGVVVKIQGIGFYPGSRINLTIINSTGNIAGFPVTVYADQQGNFNYFWNATENLGNLTIEASGTTRYVDYSNTTIEILNPYNFTGRVRDYSTGAVPSSVNLYFNGSLIAVDDEVYSINLSYGKKYDIIVLPQNLEGFERVFIKGIINEGPLEDFIALDKSPVQNSNFRNFNNILSFNPLLSSYDNITVNVSFSGSVELFKCTDWNMSQRRCNDDDSWVSIGKFTGNHAEITFSPGDPGIGIYALPFIKEDERTRRHSTVVMPGGIVSSEEGLSQEEAHEIEDVVEVDKKEEITKTPTGFAFTAGEIQHVVNFFWLLPFLGFFLAVSLFLFWTKRQDAEEHILHLLKKLKEEIKNSDLKKSKELYERIGKEYKKLDTAAKKKIHPKIVQLKKQIEKIAKK